MSADKDVTHLVNVGSNDDEWAPMRKCVCGHEFEEFHSLSIYPDICITPCPQCGRQFYFRVKMTVYEVGG